jgi:hypothetical protein
LGDAPRGELKGSLLRSSSAATGEGLFPFSARISAKTADFGFSGSQSKKS